METRYAPADLASWYALAEVWKKWDSGQGIRYRIGCSETRVSSCSGDYLASQPYPTPVHPQG